MSPAGTAARETVTFKFDVMCNLQIFLVLGHDEECDNIPGLGLGHGGGRENKGRWEKGGRESLGEGEHGGGGTMGKGTTLNSE